VTPLPTAFVVSIVMASAVAALVLGVRPRRRTIAEVRSIMQPSNLPGDRAHGAGQRRATIFGSPAVGPVLAPARLAARSIAAVVDPVTGLVERSFDDGLRLTRRSAHDVAVRLVVAALALGLTTLCTLGAAMGLGFLPRSPWWLALVGVATIAGAAVMWSDIRADVARCRREFRRTTTDFIQLVAVGLTTDQSVEEAVQFALEVGDSDLFSLVRDELATAPMRGVPLWEALDQLGTEFHQRELCEFAGSIERQGTQGVSITETVNTLATAMRAKTLDELERDADRANANLSGPTIGFVVATLVFLAYPLAIRIGEAFGG
jgi:Flp pilus assembly protein TadB